VSDEIARRAWRSFFLGVLTGLALAVVAVSVGALLSL